MKKRIVLLLTLLLFGAFATQTQAGYVVRKIYDTGSDGQPLSGTAVTNLTLNSVFPDGFTQTQELTEFFDAPVDFADNYGSFVQGYFEPPQTGDYVFWIASDDNSQLWLSTDANPENKKLIASVGDWTSENEWTKFSSQKSEKITLERGKKYYFEVLHKEGTGGDNLSVGWQLPDGTLERPMPAYYLAPYFPAGTPVSIKTQPQDIYATENDSVVFFVSVDGAQPISYQWYKNGQPIAGETLSYLKLSKVQLTDNGNTYYVKVNNTLQSDTATLFVSADVIPPEALAASTKGNLNGVYVDFSEPLLPSTATNTGNYSISGGVTVTGVEMLTPSNVVVRTTSMSPGTKYTITIKNIKDLAATPNTIAQTTLTYFMTQGAITRKLYYNIGGTSIGDLTNNVKFINNQPDAVDYMTSLETPSNIADNYGTLLQGYITAPVTGEYTFYIATDDAGTFYLSTDESPANLRQMCFVSTWTGSRQYLTGQSGEDFANHVSAPVSLQAGKRYYFELYHKEGGGGDNIAVAWQIPGGDAVQNGSDPIPGVYLDSMQPFGPVSIITQPVSVKKVELQTATFTVTASGSPPYYYQWYRNGEPIFGATGPSYTTPLIQTNDNGAQFYVVVSNLFSSVTSAVATITVDIDVEPPTISKVSADGTFSRVIITFSEMVDPSTATNVANYSITTTGGQTLNINSASMGNSQSIVILNTAQMPQNTGYILTVNNVKDQSARGNVIAADTKVNFSSWARTKGGLIREVWWRTTGSIDDAEAIINGGNPDEIGFINKFEAPVSYGDNYCQRVYGFLVPPETGYYYFYIASDDQSRLYLSTDENPANKQQISSVSSWTGNKEWSNTAITPSDPIYLQAGKYYYIEARMREGTGGDNLAVAWITPSMYDAGVTIPTNGTGEIPGIYLATYVDPTGASITIKKQPQSVTVPANKTATFTIEAVGTSSVTTNLSYQWQKNGVDIPGAWNSTYTTPLLTLSDNGASYRCIVSVPTLSVTSEVAVVTVVQDVEPPKLVSAATLINSTNVGVMFDEIVGAGADVAANYSISGVQILSATLREDQKTVALEINKAITGQTFVLTVNNVKDLAGNSIAANSTVTGKVVNMVAVDIGDPGVDPLEPGSTFVAKEGDFDVIAGGSDYWNTADFFHYVYEQRTGDFDVKVQITKLVQRDNWTHAGLMVRESLDSPSRYVNVIVDPDTGANVWECNYRATTGGSAAGWPGYSQVGPLPYPNVWVRLSRTGDVFTAYRSTDGENWIKLGTLTQTYPSTVYLGLATTAHNNNPGMTTFVEYRNYGDYVPPVVTEVKLSIEQKDGQVVVSWPADATGFRLQQATAVTGPFTDVTGTINTVGGKFVYTVNSPTGAGFFRLIK